MRDRRKRPERVEEESDEVEEESPGKKRRSMRSSSIMGSNIQKNYRSFKASRKTRERQMSQLVSESMTL